MKNLNKNILDNVLSLEIHEVASIQAVSDGRGTPEQQKEALFVIADKFGGVYNDTFDEGCERKSCNLQGRRYVGMCILEACRVSMSLVKKIKESKNDG